MINKVLDENRFKIGINVLIQSDKDLADIYNKFGPPPFWIREPGFPGLVRLILEQQLSLASAKATYEKLLNRIGEMTSKNFLDLDDTELKGLGFSRQKTAYCRNLAEQCISKNLNFETLSGHSDLEVKNILIKQKGIGPWTADNYLLLYLKRQDIWPIGDLALLKAIMEIKNLKNLPTEQEFTEIGAPWRPWRSVAARLLWHFYLSS